jgi:hypothetical protein
MQLASLVMVQGGGTQTYLGISSSLQHSIFGKITNPLWLCKTNISPLPWIYFLSKTFQGLETKQVLVIDIFSVQLVKCIIQVHLFLKIIFMGVSLNPVCALN